MKKIIFKATQKKYQTLDKLPVPAGSLLPDWYKDTQVLGDVKKVDELNISANLTNGTFKKCIPILDSLSLGYILTTQYDVLLKHIDNNWDLSWKTQETVFTVHGENSKNIETPYGYYPRVAKYMYNRIPITPKGYSTLFISPIGYSNLPFKALAGVVDTDTNVSAFALPVWISKNHKGIVKAGTPLAQLIPFKRDNWKAISDSFKDDEYYIQEQSTFGRVAVNHYAKNIWQRKKYK